MEKQRKIKVLSIIALVVAIFGMSLGFAAFSTTLNISSSASVAPSSDDFKVIFSSSSDGTETSIIYPTSGDATAAKVSGLSLSEIQVSFSEPGESALYSAYIYNAGKYDAYITDVNVGGKTCTPESGTTKSLVDEVCDDIYVAIAGFGTGYFIDEPTVLSGYKLAPGESYEIEFGVHYPEGSNAADGPFSIAFDDVTINVSTADSPEINFTAYDQSEESPYDFKAAEGMTWAQWIYLYGEDAWAFGILDDNRIGCFMGGYLEDVVSSDLIEDGKEYICEYDF